MTFHITISKCMEMLTGKNQNPGLTPNILITGPNANNQIIVTKCSKVNSNISFNLSQICKAAFDYK